MVNGKLGLVGVIKVEDTVQQYLNIRELTDADNSAVTMKNKKQV